MVSSVVFRMDLKSVGMEGRVMCLVGGSRPWEPGFSEPGMPGLMGRLEDLMSDEVVDAVVGGSAGSAVVWALTFGSEDIACENRTSAQLLWSFDAIQKGKWCRSIARKERQRDAIW